MPSSKNKHVILYQFFHLLKIDNSVCIYLLWLVIFEIHILHFVEVNIGEIMDVMQDLSNLKLAIQSNNKERVENIYELYQQEVQSFLHKFLSEQLNRREMYTMASVLIPFDLPFPLHESLCSKTTGQWKLLIQFSIISSVSFIMIVLCLTASDCCRAFWEY